MLKRKSNSVLHQLQVGVEKIDWTAFVQSVATGVGSTVGMMFVYVIVICIIIAALRRSQRLKMQTNTHMQTQTQTQTQDDSLLNQVLTFARPIQIARDVGVTNSA